MNVLNLARGRVTPLNRALGPIGKGVIFELPEATSDVRTVARVVGYCAVGGQITYTVNVKDYAGQPVADCLVRVQVTASTITSITNNTVSGTIDDPPVSGSCLTNASGEIYVVVTAGDDYDANRFMAISAHVGGTGGMMSLLSQGSSTGGDGSASLSTFCYDPNAEIGLVICYDVTGSMNGGAAAKGGLSALTGFIASHAPWIKIGGIKIEDTLCHSLGFTRDHDSVAEWINLGNQSGTCDLSNGDDEPEIQLDGLVTGVNYYFLQRQLFFPVKTYARQPAAWRACSLHSLNIVLAA